MGFLVFGDLFKADLQNVTTLRFNTGDLIIVLTTVSFAIYSLVLNILNQSQSD